MIPRYPPPPRALGGLAWGPLVGYTIRLLSGLLMAWVIYKAMEFGGRFHL